MNSPLTSSTGTHTEMPFCAYETSFVSPSFCMVQSETPQCLRKAVPRATTQRDCALSQYLLELSREPLQLQTTYMIS